MTTSRDCLQAKLTGSPNAVRQYPSQSEGIQIPQRSKNFWQIQKSLDIKNMHAYNLQLS